MSVIIDTCLCTTRNRIRIRIQKQNVDYKISNGDSQGAHIKYTQTEFKIQFSRLFAQWNVKMNTLTSFAYSSHGILGIYWDFESKRTEPNRIEPKWIENQSELFMLIHILVRSFYLVCADVTWRDVVPNERTASYKQQIPNCDMPMNCDLPFRFLNWIHNAYISSILHKVAQMLQLQPVKASQNWTTKVWTLNTCTHTHTHSETSKSMIKTHHITKRSRKNKIKQNKIQ